MLRPDDALCSGLLQDISTFSFSFIASACTMSFYFPHDLLAFLF